MTATELLPCRIKFRFTRSLDRIVAMPDKIPFYEKFGFSANEAQRLRIMYQVHG